MAHHKSAKKRIRQTLKRTEQNKAQKSESRSVIKAVREAISKKDKETALPLLPKAQKLLARLAQSGIIKKNTAARKTSRLSSQVAKL